MIVLYGIKNCDTVKRARQRLDDEGIAHRFHDFKTEGLSAERAAGWIKAAGLDTVVNRKGTTWRRLDQAERDSLDEGTAPALLAREPSLVKRPVIEYPGGISIGFARKDEDAIVALLK